MDAALTVSPQLTVSPPSPVTLTVSPQLLALVPEHVHALGASAVIDYLIDATHVGLEAIRFASRTASGRSAASPTPAPPRPAPTPTPPEEEAKDDESPAAPEDVAEEDEPPTPRDEEAEEDKSLAPVLKKLCVSTCEVTFILVFPYDAVDLYAVKYMDYRARIVKWTNRNAGYVGETVDFLSTFNPEFTLKVAVLAKLSVYDPIGCPLLEPFVAFHDVVEYVEMGTGTIAARDAARTVSVDAAAALYIAPGGPRTTVPSSWAATDCRYSWFGGLFDCDGSLQGRTRE